MSVFHTACVPAITAFLIFIYEEFVKFANEIHRPEKMTYTASHIMRLIHFDNLEDILKNGMYSKNSGHIIPNYVNIGDTILIRQRENFKVRIDPPDGNLGDYIPFYFAGHSPMLLNIKTGNRGIRQRPQNELIYIVCRINNIIEHCPEWCFTDGHAKNNLTKFYNHTDDLSKLDWDIIRQRFWNDTEDDMDRMRRKQAEFLVKGHVPTKCICGIIVLDQEQEEKVKSIQQKTDVIIPVYVDKQRKYFYP